MKADSRVVGKIPDSISFEAAAPLFCAGATIYGALKAADTKPDQWIAIVGMGGLGHLGTQYAKAKEFGLKVIALDNRQEGLDLIKTLPKHLQPDETFLINSEDSKNKAVKKINGMCYESNPGVDRIVIATEDRSLIKVSEVATVWFVGRHFRVASNLCAKPNECRQRRWIRRIPRGSFLTESNGDSYGLLRYFRRLTL